MPGIFNSFFRESRFRNVPYAHVEYTITLHKDDHWGVATFSKFPIVNQGKIVFNTRNNNICIYTDLIINSDGHVEGLIMGVGGFLGVGEKKVAVTRKALSFEVTDGKMNVVMPDANKDVLAAAPAYKRVNPPKGWVQRAVEKGQELKDKSAVTAKDAIDKAKENAGPAMEAAKQKAGEAIEHAKEAAKGVVDKAKEAAKPADAKP